MSKQKQVSNKTQLMVSIHTLKTVFGLQPEPSLIFIFIVTIKAPLSYQYSHYQGY